MTAKRLYSLFQSYFPWLAADVTKYVSDKEDGGIKLYLKSGEILNFSINKKGDWFLKKVQ